MQLPTKTAPDTRALDASDSPEPTDEALVARARAGDTVAFELLMRRHNRKVYRAVRTVLRDGTDVEDVMQQAYVLAFTHLDQFEGTARWSTWMCRIAYNEALARVRQHGRFVSIDAAKEDTVEDISRAPLVDPERSAGRRELARLVELELDRLPDIYRAVVMFREVEGLSVADTAEVLGVEEPVVKTRLHRARTMLRAAIEARLGSGLEDSYAFEAPRCDRVVAGVLARLPRR
jgi:RNA polymerase sigma-70 factor (ECF subfamily)